MIISIFLFTFQIILLIVNLVLFIIEIIIKFGNVGFLLLKIELKFIFQIKANLFKYLKQNHNLLIFLLFLLLINFAKNKIQSCFFF